ncbi:MAG TPA: hypothetical protein VEI97_15235, partial [bacterium]|nr:hypothetical protein [bacterium]
EPEQTTGKFVNVRWQQSSESTSGAQPFLVVTPLEDVRRPNIVATFGTDRSLEHARRVVIDRTVLEMFEHHLALKRTLPADMRQLESTLGVYRRRRWAGGPGEPVVVLLNRAENTVVAPSGSLQYVDGETPCFRTLPDPGAVTGATETFQVGTF